jgi:methyl-accepting chemotaxis protein
VQSSQLQSKNDTEFEAAMQLRKGEIYVSQINLNREQGVIETPHVPIIRYATPIYSANGQRKGIIIANVLAEDIFKFASKKDVDKQTAEEFFAINAQGYYINHQNKDKLWGFALNKETETVKKDYPDISGEILSKQKGLINEEKNIISYRQITPLENQPESQFILVKKIPKAVIFASIESLKLVALVITILSLTIILIIGVIILRGLVKSILEITGFVGSFSVQLLTTVEEQERMANQQSASVRETTVTMDELNASSQQSSAQAESAATGAKQALTTVGNGNNSVDQVLSEMGNVKNKVETIAEKITQLSEQTHQIGSVSDLVNDLASQTNMLALNAAVEAVRAGENGKGFAVVAAEIRKLADESKKSSQKINDLVSQIQRSIQSTVMVTDEGTKNVEQGVEIARQMAGVFAEVANSMERIVESTQQIALNSKQQAIATQQVTQTMNSLNQGALENARGISQTKTGTEKLAQVVKKLEDVI